MRSHRHLFISTPTLAVIKKALAELCTHSQMTNLMEQYGFAVKPGVAIHNKLDRASAYLDHADWADVKTVRNLLDFITHIFVELDSELADSHDEYVTRLHTNEAAGRIRKVLGEREDIYWDCKGFDTSVLEGTMVLGHATDSIQGFGLAEVSLETRRILENVDSDPGDAITSSKALLESACRHVLADFGENPSPSAGMGELFKQTLRRLSLLPEQVSEQAKGVDAARKVLRSMQATVQGLAELRNLYGDPHGKGPGYRGLQSRHARLAATMAGAIAVFLVETHERRRQK